MDAPRPFQTPDEARTWLHQFTTPGVPHTDLYLTRHARHQTHHDQDQFALVLAAEALLTKGPTTDDCL